MCSLLVNDYIVHRNKLDYCAHMVFFVNHRTTVKSKLLYLSTKSYAATFRHKELGRLQQILWFWVKNAMATFKTETLSKTSYTMTSRVVAQRPKETVRVSVSGFGQTLPEEETRWSTVSLTQDAKTCHLFIMRH